jgi:hypothetical protein
MAARDCTAFEPGELGAVELYCSWPVGEINTFAHDFLSVWTPFAPGVINLRVTIDGRVLGQEALRSILSAVADAAGVDRS